MLLKVQNEETKEEDFVLATFNYEFRRLKTFDLDKAFKKNPST